MKKTVKYILSAIIIIAAASTAIYLHTRPLEAEIVEVVPADIQTWFIEDGTAKAAEDYHIISNVTGKVTEVYVSNGDSVDAGTVIAQIDASDYLTNIQIHKSNIEGYNAQIADVSANEQNKKDSYYANIEQLKTKLVQTETQLRIKDVTAVAALLPNEQMKILELSIEQCQIELDYDKNKHEVNAVLFKNGIISSEELNGYEQKYIAAQNKMDQLLLQQESLHQEISRLNGLYESDNLNELNENAKNEFNMATLDEIRVQIASMEKEAAKDYKTNAIQNYRSLIAIEESTIKSLEEDVTDCRIVAERAGTVSNLPVINASFIYQGELLCTVKESKDFVVESYVSTEDVVHLAVGSQAELIQKTREGDLSYHGTITKIESWAEEKISAMGVVENKVKVTIQPETDIAALGSGFDVDVKYFTYDGKACIVLPNSSFFRYNDKDFVFVAAESSSRNTGTLTAVPVVKGASTNTETVVESGLQIGDIVIKNATGEGVSEGARVTWKP